jgi:hypothetical protein
LRLDQADDRTGDGVLEVKDVGNGAVEPLGPEVLACRTLDELRRNAHLVGGPPDAALEEVANVELPGDLPGIDGPALVDEARGAGDDGEGAEAAERRNQVFDDPVGKVVLLRAVRKVGEGQYRY